MGKKKTHGEYVEELKLVNPDIEVVGIYVGANIKILHRCLKDGYEWLATPHSILMGKGCPKCANKVRRTHEEYIKDVNIINKNIEVLENFINTKTHLLHKCKICNYEWKVRPEKILSGYGCPNCANIIKKTHEKYIEEVFLLNPNIEVVGTYLNASTSILHKCLIDEYEWFAKPTNILKGRGCPKCAGKMKKSQEQYVYEVSQINQDVEVIGIYVNSVTPILHKCKKDGEEWYASPVNILNGRGCPRCIESSGERQVRLWLDNNNFVYETQKSFKDCRDKLPLPFDFYLPDYNILIEYDGRQHYEPVETFGGQEAFDYTVKHDNIKTEYCKNKGITLLRIPYFKNVEEELNNFLFI